MQNEHGCSPSSEQMIFPQLRQFGAGSKRGWILALHVHLRAPPLSVGFVDTSKAAMAAVRSLILFVVSDPLDDEPVPVLLPPAREADLAAFDLTFGKRSEITGPEAEGGFLAGVGLGAGDWFREEVADASREEINGDGDRPVSSVPSFLALPSCLRLDETGM